MSVVLLVAGCGGSEDPSALETGTIPSAPATTAAPAWNPCSGLTAGPISAALGKKVTVEDGSADDVRCALLPVTKGDPTFNLTYVWTGVSLDDTFAGMSIDEGNDVSTPSIPGADDARLIVNESPADGALTVTGFVENGDLVETVNGLALAPYDTQAVVAAMKVVLTQLSAAAPAAP